MTKLLQTQTLILFISPLLLYDKQEKNLIEKISANIMIKPTVQQKWNIFIKLGLHVEKHTNYRIVSYIRIKNKYAFTANAYLSLHYKNAQKQPLFHLECV